MYTTDPTRTVARTALLAGLLLTTACASPQSSSEGNAPSTELPEIPFAELAALNDGGVDFADGGVPPVEKIWRGEASQDPRVLRISAPGVSNTGCSAVPFARRGNNTILLTSAHCVPATPGFAQLDIYRAGLGGFLGRFTTFAVPNPNWSGPEDTGDDIGLISVPMVYPSLSALYLGLLSTSTEMEALGFGTNTQYSMGGFGVLRTGYQNGTFRPDWIGSRHFLDDDDHHVNLCMGDSGGPARLLTSTHPVVGIASNKSGGTEFCRTNDGKQRWTRVSAHMTSFIEALIGACRRVGNTAECW